MENLNLSRQGISVVASDNSQTHEVSEEFVLPDYIPEIRKLLACKASVLPESRFVSDETVLTSGSVTYLVIYTDDEGKLRATPLSSSYEVELGVSKSPKNVFVDTTVDSVLPRVNAPRRLSIKSRLKSRAMCIESQEIQENISPKSSADEMFLERKLTALDTFEISTATLDNIKISDELDMQGIKEAKPLWCDASAQIKEYKVRARGISVRGDVSVKCVCQTENGVVTLTRTLPLAEELECEGASPTDMARINARCVSLSISSEQNLDTCQLFFDLCLELEAETARKKQVQATLDCYSTKYETSTSYKELEGFEVAKMASLSFTCTDGIKRKSNEAKDIVDQIIHPVLEKTEIKGSRLIMLGKLLASIIGKTEQNENGEVEYLCDSYEIPFKYELELGKNVDSYIPRISLECGLASARYEGDKLYISCELYPVMTIFEKYKARVLDSATINKDKEIDRDKSCVCVYFPKDGDTLWEIAKRYHTTENKIASQNDLDGTELKKSLIV